MISLLCPTRNRVDMLRRMWVSACDTANNPDDLELVLYVDKDDTETLTLNPMQHRGTIKHIMENKKEPYGNLHNICAANASHDILMGCADDVVFRTQGWDTKVLAEFDRIPDKIGYIYPNDGHHGENLGTHGFFHKNWLDVLGYLVPPIFTVDYSDNYVMDVSKGIGRSIYIEDILVEHMHWTFGKSEFDSTSREAHIRRNRDNNAKIYKESQDRIKEDIRILNNYVSKNL
jgi:hypothetical protein